MTNRGLKTRWPRLQLFALSSQIFSVNLSTGPRYALYLNKYKVVSGTNYCQEIGSPGNIWDFTDCIACTRYKVRMMRTDNKQFSYIWPLCSTTNRPMGEFHTRPITRRKPKDRLDVMFVLSLMWPWLWFKLRLFVTSIGLYLFDMRHTLKKIESLNVIGWEILIRDGLWNCAKDYAYKKFWV